MTETRIPFHRAAIEDEEIKAVEDVLRSGWLTTGPVTHQFEKEFAAYIGSKYALAVNSGTSALQLALDAIGLTAGDEVIVPTYTFTATAEVVTYFGARPVLCDSIHDGFNMDPGDVARCVTERTKAIIPVHIGGEPCELDAIHAIADRYDIRVIEDAAHALPCRYGHRKIGTISDLTAFSFYATKTITTGEGGMLTTNNDEYADRAAMMRLHGIGKDAWNRYSHTGSWFYQVHDAGYKLNLCDVLSALGRAQLKKCDSFQKRRSEIASIYQEKLAKYEDLDLPPAGDDVAHQHSWHLFIVRIRPGSLGMTRDELIEELKRAGIGTSVHFIPLHRHPYYIREYGYSQNEFPNAEDAYSRCISLPIYPGLTDVEACRVADTLVKLLRASRNISKCVL
jgi:dTDP-4-amino-4,6-dideoxygalactose transaminase